MRFGSFNALDTRASSLNSSLDPLPSQHIETPNDKWMLEKKLRVRDVSSIHARGER